MLWVEAERWRQMDVTRRFLPCNRIDLLRDCSHLQREIDGVCADLWLLPSPPLQKSRASPLAPPVPSTTPTSSIRPDGSAAKAAQSSAVPTPLPAPRRTTSPSRPRTPRPPSPQRAPPAQPLWVSLAKFIMVACAPLLGWVRELPDPSWQTWGRRCGSRRNCELYEYVTCGAARLVARLGGTEGASFGREGSRASRSGVVRTA